MRLAFAARAMAVAAVPMAAALSAAPARAQPSPCAPPPPDAVRTVPAPFDAYMRLTCREPVGQGLVPVEGYRWTMPDGQPIGLLATSTSGSPDANGAPRFQAGWYVELSPVALSPAEQHRIKGDLGRAVRPRFLDKASLLGLRARTSSGETKLVLLLLPDTRTRRPAWLIGFECNGACFREDAQPLMFAGSAG